MTEEIIRKPRHIGHKIALVCAGLCGLMMLPAVSAKLWHDTLPAQLLNASAQAALAGYSGLLLSYHLDTPSGPTIIGCAGALYALSLLASPGGWLPPVWISPTIFWMTPAAPAPSSALCPGCKR